MQIDTDAFGTPAEEKPNRGSQDTPADKPNGEARNGAQGDAQGNPKSSQDEQVPLDEQIEASRRENTQDPIELVGELIPDSVMSALSDSILTPLVQYVIGPGVMLWLLVFVGVAGLGGQEAASRFFGRSLGLVLSGAVAAFWLPVVLAAKATGRAVPMVGFGLINLVGEKTPRVKNPATAEIEKRRTVDPRRPHAPIGHGRQWTPDGGVEAVSVGVAAESGAAKGQTYVNPYIEHTMRHSPEHLIVMEAKPNLELSNVVYANKRPGDVVRELTLQAKDRYSTAADLWRDPDEIADLVHMLTHDPNAKDSHWNGKAADLITAAVRETRLPLPQVADAITDRELLASLRERYPRIDNIADQDREWGYIRSTAARVLSPLSSPTVRRVVAGGHPGHPVASPDYAAGNRRVITIIRPDWRSAERTKGILTAVLHAEVMAAVDGGYAGGPGTKIVLDEAASCVRLDRLGSYLELARGGRINIVYVIQSLAQLASQLGPKESARVWTATEAKIVGATSDVQLATEIARLSGRRNVHYSGPVQHGDLIGSRREHERDAVQAHEITGQQEGEFTTIHRGRVAKWRVAPNRYHYTWAAPTPAKRPRISGVAHPAAYAPLRLDGGPQPDPDDLI